MKKILKIIILLLLFGTVFMLQSCEKDLYEDHIEQSRLKTLNLKDVPMLKNAINSKRAAMRNTANKEAVDYLSLINTDEVKLIENNDGSKDYTFSLQLDQSEKLTNLIIKEYGSEYYYKIIEYTSTHYTQWIDDVKNNGYSTQPMQVELFDLSRTNGACFTYAYICPSCKHSTFWNNVQECEYNMGAYSLVMLSHPCSVDNFNAPDHIGGGGGGSGGSGSYNTVPTPCTRCDFNSVDPCDKIKNLTNTLPELQEQLDVMAAQTNQPEEWGKYKLTSASVIQTTPVDSNGQIYFPIPASGKYVFMAHTHNSPSQNTYSVFSWIDLEAIARLIRKGKVDTDNFVAYLATADGTYYALTIENPAFFSQFFATERDSDFDLAIGTIRGREMDKYYDLDRQGYPPLISENSTDVVADEKAFLKMLQNNTLGATLFEADATFTTFTKVSLDTNTNQLIKINCQ